MEKLLTPRFGILEKKERSLFIFEYFFSPRNVITCYIKIMIIPHNVIYLLNKNISIRLENSFLHTNNIYGIINNFFTVLSIPFRLPINKKRATFLEYYCLTLCQNTYQHINLSLLSVT